MLIQMRSFTYRQAVSLLEAEVGDDMIALDERIGTCFGFNPVAASVWKSLTNPKTFEEIQDELLATYDVSEEDCASDLRALLDQLMLEGLIRPVD